LTITKQDIKIKQVILSKEAMKYLARMPRGSARKITRAIRDIAAGACSRAKTRKLSGRDLWRLKVDGLRVIYKLDDKNGILLVVKIGPRGDVYK
jgi:mRNA interferase RelE/StbE